MFVRPVRGVSFGAVFPRDSIPTPLVFKFLPEVYPSTVGNSAKVVKGRRGRRCAICETNQVVASTVNCWWISVRLPPTNRPEKFATVIERAQVLRTKNRAQYSTHAGN